MIANFKFKGGQPYFGAAVNSLVHVFMYTYYALSVIPSLKDKLWWKKYITIIQLVDYLFLTASNFNNFQVFHSKKDTICNYFNPYSSWSSHRLLIPGLGTISTNNLHDSHVDIIL